MEFCVGHHPIYMIKGYKLNVSGQLRVKAVRVSPCCIVSESIYKVTQTSTTFGYHKKQQTCEGVVSELFFKAHTKHEEPSLHEKRHF